jgi:hypothetical protein
MCVINTGKASFIIVPFENMNKSTLERNPRYVRSMERPSLVLIFKCMKEFTLERNPMYISPVVKPSFLLVTIEIMKGLTLGRMPN